MGEETVTTAVDDLLEYLRGKDKVAMLDAATVLGVPIETIQAWVDFLVEEKILGIEYKFTKPFIYINKETKDARKAHTSLSIDTVRQEYFEHARQKKIPDAKIAELWKTHVRESLEQKKAYFIEQAGRRRLSDPLSAWQQYCASILARS